MEKTYRNINFTKRNYDCMNIVACVSHKAPNSNYVEDDKLILNGLDEIFRENGVQYYGFL